jgi:tripartite-type tricarboxylate transporter receptor subunit TctC
MRRLAWLMACLLVASAAHAETFPGKPIRMIVPFPAGSATDGQARLIGTHFQRVFGHGFIVENMPGATGAIAARAVARAAPDGYTLLISSVSTHSANAWLYNNLGYDPIADFTPVALIARAPSTMVVRAERPFRTLQDFVAFAKANPDKLNFAYGNMGSLAGGAMLNAYAGIRTTAVSYRGTPQATTDLLGGQIDFVVMDASQTQEHVSCARSRQRAPRAWRRFPMRRPWSRPAIGTTCCTPGRACTGPPGCRARLSPPSTGRSAKRSTRPRANAFSRPTAPKPAP